MYGKVCVVNDQLDVSVHDGEVLAEIELMTNLIIATSDSEGPLPQQRIDEILGIDPCPCPGSGEAASAGDG